MQRRMARSGADSSSVPRAAHTDTRAAHSDGMVQVLLSGVGALTAMERGPWLTGTVQK